MNPNLESHLAAWRQSMQAAGIGPGPVRDELESHLLEAGEELVRGGKTEAEAFAVASARLGTAEEIRRERDAALSHPSPWMRMLRCELFPANLDRSAWVALVVGPFFAVGAGGNLPGGAIRILIPVFLGFTGVIGLIGACLWLKRRALHGARMLGFFWGMALWFAFFGILNFWFADPNAGMGGSGAGLFHMGAAFFYLLTLPALATVFLLWSRRLRIVSR